MAHSARGGCRSLTGTFASVVSPAGFPLHSRPPAQRAMWLRSLTGRAWPTWPHTARPRERLPRSPVGGWLLHSSPRLLHSSRAGAPRYLGCLQQADCWFQRGIQILPPEPFL